MFDEEKLKEMKKNGKESITKEEKAECIIKYMMSNTVYISWLKKFTQDKGKFYDKDSSVLRNLSDYDKRNIDMLYLFFTGISRYAKENNIRSIPVSKPISELNKGYGNYYKVKFYDFAFEIGFFDEFGKLEFIYFFNKTSLENENDFIDFNDIITYTKKGGSNKISASLEIISNMIITTYESGVPIEEIVNTLTGVIRGITSNNDKPKTLIR